MFVNIIMKKLDKVIKDGCYNCNYGALDHTFCISDEEYDKLKHDDELNELKKITLLATPIILYIISHVKKYIS